MDTDNDIIINYANHSLCFNVNDIIINYAYHVHRMHHVVSEPYELSQDLIAKHLEVLENKYGGAQRAKRAATTIQKAFRK